MDVMLYKLTSATLYGIEAQAVDMEIDIAGGLPGMIIVGLPDTSIRESKDRVRAAMKNSGFPLPPAKIVINLAPADLKKEGSGFDLPLSVGLLAHLGHFPAARLADYLFLGELALDGRVKPVRGVLACAVLAEKEGFRGIVCPKGNEKEAALVRSLDVYGLNSLTEVVNLLKDPAAWDPAECALPTGKDEVGSGVNFAHIHGQAQVKRALEVAAAGGHHVMMTGPPGAGKTLLARAVPSIMPPLSELEIIEVTRIYSAVGLLGRRGAILNRPFRSPHHTVTDAGLIGGGLFPRPGEVTLAHQGILFLDELPEFRRKVLEDLRQPLEDGQITISRGARAVTFPSDFMLMAAMNPYEDVFTGAEQTSVYYGDAMRRRYYSKISGPLMDRIDIQVEVPKVPYGALSAVQGGEESKEIRHRIIAARNRQEKRLRQRGKKRNDQMEMEEIKRFCVPDGEGMRLLETAVERLGFSARGYTRVLKVARTIADLAGEDRIRTGHISEAIQYRLKNASIKTE